MKKYFFETPTRPEPAAQINCKKSLVDPTLAAFLFAVPCCFKLQKPRALSTEHLYLYTVNFKSTFQYLTVFKTQTFPVKHASGTPPPPPPPPPHFPAKLANDYTFTFKPPPPTQNRAARALELRFFVKCDFGTPPLLGGMITESQKTNGFIHLNCHCQ